MQPSLSDVDTFIREVQVPLIGTTSQFVEILPWPSARTAVTESSLHRKVSHYQRQVRRDRRINSGRQLWRYGFVLNFGPRWIAKGVAVRRL